MTKNEINDIIIYYFLGEKNDFDGKIEEDFNLYTDVGGDSIDVMNIILMLEARSEKKISDREVAKIRLVKDLYKLFEDEGN